MGDLRVRPLDLEREVDAFLAVANQARLEPMSRERWLEVQAQAPRPPTNLVGEAGGRPVAVASVGDEEFADDCAFAWIGTGPADRRRGYGRAMLPAVEEALSERRMAEVRTAVRDDDAESRAWAERRGFAVFDHTFRSRLDLSKFDPARHREAIERAEVAGLRLARFGPGDDPDRLYELFVRLVRDVPDQVDPPDRAYFQRDVVERADAITVLAYDGDKAVGLATLLPLEAGEYLNAMTGVVAEYRGRGLARALKVLAGEAAREAGRRFLVANNNARNAPMLAVNDALGFERESGALHLRRLQ